MPSNPSWKDRRPTTWWQFRLMQILLWCLLPVGPVFLLYGASANDRDRPSLQWPKAAGTIVQSGWTYHQTFKRSSSYYTANVGYIYHVDGRVYAGNRVKLWDPDLRWAGEVTNKAFVAAHPVHSPVDVYYNPAHPENAALIPGADEWRNRLYIWGGGILFVLVVWSVFRSRTFFAKAIASAKAADAAREGNWGKIFP
jgi:hypothetical protein